MKIYIPLVWLLVSGNPARVPSCLKAEPVALNDWRPHAKPAPGSRDMYCGNYSRLRWKVGLSDGDLQIEPWTAPIAVELPFSIQEAGVYVRKGARQHVLRVEDGWLVGLDAGEFGGSLWWFDYNGTHRVRLSDENVQGFVEAFGTRFVMTGLSHMTMDTGHLVELVRGEPTRWRTTRSIDLGASPVAFTSDADQSLVILTTRGLVRLDHRGSTHQLARIDYDSLYPTSLAVLPSGTIYVGMNLFVLRLTPTPEGYREQWFVPKGCAGHEIRGFDCVCLGDKAAQ